MQVAIVGPADGRNTLLSSLRRFAASVCAEADICCADTLGELPPEPWNMALIFTYDDDYEDFCRFQNEHPDCEIVLWAQDETWAREGLRLHTEDFLVLPVSDARFAQAMRLCRRSWLEGMRFVKGTADGEAVRVYCSEIRYAEADGHRCTVCTQNGRYSVSMSFSALSKLLGDGFVRCHRCFLANIRCIEALEPEGVRLTDGEVIPVGTGKTAAAAGEKIRAFRSEWAI